MLGILAKSTQQDIERLEKDTDRMLYMTPPQAKDYGIIDKVLESSKDLPKALPAL
jgi:ATP-dependent Clp protease protease subunit